MPVNTSVSVGMIFVFDLKTRMINSEALIQTRLDRGLDGLDSGPVFPRYNHMTVKRCLMLLHLPEMHMMDIHDTINTSHRLNDGTVVNVRRTSQH